MARALVLLVMVLAAVSCSHFQQAQTLANNHIIFIVDGMGPTHVTAARLFKGGPEARLELEKMPYTGIVRTYSTDDFVTDSAAAATALASGVKTYNGSIGLGDSKKSASGSSDSLNSILKRAKEAGKSVGLVTTTRITHATPAAYYAHVAHRDMEEEIAAQLVHAGIDIVIGGGSKFFTPSSQGGVRRDGQNLFEEFHRKNYRVVKSNEEFRALSVRPEQSLIALLDENHLPYDASRRKGPSLTQMVDYAIKHLSNNPRGYFLVVEAGKVDHASHENRAESALSEMLAFDKALGRSLKEVDKGTLVLVTADHETGGLTLNGYAPHEVASGKSLLRNHVRDPKDPKTSHGLISWSSGPGFGSSYTVDDAKPDFRHKATYETPSAYHTGVDVPIMAIGPGASRFTGFLNNSDIAHITAEILGLAPLK